MRGVLSNSALIDRILNNNALNSQDAAQMWDFGETCPGIMDLL